LIRAGGCADVVEAFALFRLVRFARFPDASAMLSRSPMFGVASNT
jgi:hypothetical protein